jgi:hypothetical protein
MIYSVPQEHGLKLQYYHTLLNPLVARVDFPMLFFGARKEKLAFLADSRGIF